MPLPNVSLPAIWDLPVMAGVPAVLGPITGTGLGASLSSVVTNELSAILTEQASAQWGIYLGAQQVLTAAHVISLDYQAQYQVSDAPIENGGFVSYNKVKVPFTSRILMVCDGTELGLSGLATSIQTLVGGVTGTSGLSVRKDFLTTLDSIVADYNLYTVVTPERSYSSANVVGYRFRRSNQGGVTMLAAEILLQEIRSTATNSYMTPTAKPEGQPAQQLGTVQASEITAATNANLAADISAAAGVTSP